MLDVEKRIRKLIHSEKEASTLLLYLWYRPFRYSLMLYHELIRDDVTVRAESLSYLTLFSSLPILAGFFLIFGFLSQWGPAQEQFQDLIATLLQPIPDQYRETIMAFVLEFKDQYAQGITQKSTSIGVFALVVMLWVGAKVFFNVENLMNQIWLIHENRLWMERIQNFILSLVVFPLLFTASVSVPKVLDQFLDVNLGAFFNQALPNLLCLSALLFMYRYFPNTKVSWKSAWIGTLFSGLLMWVASKSLGIYFSLGTATAYGKMGALPIIAFFIYVEWLIFILGTEVCFLVQNPSVFWGKRMNYATLAEALVMEDLLLLLEEQYTQGDPLYNVNVLTQKLQVSLFAVQKALLFLMERQVVAEVWDDLHSFDGDVQIVLKKQIQEEQKQQLLREYLGVDKLVQSFDVTGTFNGVLAPLHKK